MMKKILCSLFVSISITAYPTDLFALQMPTFDSTLQKIKRVAHKTPVQAIAVIAIFYCASHSQFAQPFVNCGNSISLPFVRFFLDIVRTGLPNGSSAQNFVFSSVERLFDNNVFAAIGLLMVARFSYVFWRLRKMEVKMIASEKRAVQLQEKLKSHERTISVIESSGLFNCIKLSQALSEDPSQCVVGSPELFKTACEYLVREVPAIRQRMLESEEDMLQMKKDILNELEYTRREVNATHEMLQGGIRINDTKEELLRAANSSAKRLTEDLIKAVEECKSLQPDHMLLKAPAEVDRKELESLQATVSDVLSGLKNLNLKIEMIAQKVGGVVVSDTFLAAIEEGKRLLRDDSSQLQRNSHQFAEEVVSEVKPQQLLVSGSVE